MTIIEIRQTATGEVAYVLEKGKIYKLPVEDLTGGSGDYDEAPEEVPAPRRAVRRRVVPRGELTIDDIPDDLPMALARAEMPIPEIGKPVVRTPSGPRPKGIPANMIDLFRKPPELA